MTQTPTIGIMTVLSDVELSAAKIAFGIPSDQIPTTHAGDRYWITEVVAVNNVKYRVVITCLGLSGNSISTLLTERMISRFNPELMLLVGIGCGTSKFALGDVATSDAVWAYEYVKTQRRNDLDRSRAAITPYHLRDDVTFFTDLRGWHRSFLQHSKQIDSDLLPRKPVERPALHRAQWMASGEKVMGSGDLARLNKLHDLIRVGEMEGYGFALACQQRRPAIPWIVIRGISDFGDASKDGGADPDAPRKDEYHAIAAQAAASFAREFVSNMYSGAEPPVALAQGGADAGHATAEMEVHVQNIFSSDHDPAFNKVIIGSFRKAKEIIAVSGMGLSWLKGNTELIGAIASALRSQPELRVEIYHGDAENAGIQNRVAEEASASARDGRSYSKTWPQDHIASLRGGLANRLSPEELGRVKFVAVDCLPMVTVVQVDSDYFWYPYGTPNIRGKESPWFALFRPDPDSPVREFLDRVLTYYRRGTALSDGTST